MAAGELHEDVFEAGLASGEVFELQAARFNRRQQSRNRLVRLGGTQHRQAVVVQHRLDTGSELQSSADPDAAELVANSIM